jgi:AcrR family transcriptional regulator
MERATLYYHAEGKEDLLYAICKSSIEQLANDVREATEDISDPLAQLRHELEGLLDRTVVWFRRNGELSPSELGATLCRLFLEDARHPSAYRRDEQP